MMEEMDACTRNKKKKTIDQETGETKNVSQAATVLNSKSRGQTLIIWKMNTLWREVEIVSQGKAKII